MNDILYVFIESMKRVSIIGLIFSFIGLICVAFDNEKYSQNFSLYIIGLIGSISILLMITGFDSHLKEKEDEY